MIKFFEIGGDKVMKKRHNYKNLIIPLILAIISLLYDFIICYLVFQYEEYDFITKAEYYKVFQLSAIFLAMASLLLLTKAKKGLITESKYRFFSISLLILFFGSVYILLKYYQQNFVEEYQESILNALMNQVFNSTIIYSSPKTDITVILHLTFVIMFVVISIVAIIGFINKNIEIFDEEEKETTHNFKKPLERISYLSLGFEYNTIP